MILISGEALIDLIPDPEWTGATTRFKAARRTMSRSASARLGAPTAFIARISADANGEALAAALAASGVDLGLVARDPRPTTLAFVMRGTAQTGSRYCFYLDATSFDGPWPFPTLGRTAPASARRLHLRRSSRARRARRRGAGCGARATRPPASTPTSARWSRPTATPSPRSSSGRRARDFVKASEEDLEWLYPGRAVEDCLRRGRRWGRTSASRRSAARARSPISASERIEIAPRKVDGRRHGRRRRQLHVGAPLRDGPRRRARAPARRRRRGSGSQRWPISPPAPRRSPAPAKAPTRRRSPRSRRPTLIQRRGDARALLRRRPAGLKRA